MKCSGIHYRSVYLYHYTFRKNKYFQAPFFFLVLQLVTNSGLYSVPWKDQIAPGRTMIGPSGPQYSYHGPFRYYLVLPDTDWSPLIVTS